MSPYKLRERLIKDVPEVKIYPTLTNEDYSEEEYQEVLKDQLKMKKDLETGNVRKIPIFTWKEKEFRAEEFYEKGWYRPRFAELPESMFRGGKDGVN